MVYTCDEYQALLDILDNSSASRNSGFRSSIYMTAKVTSTVVNIDKGRVTYLKERLMDSIIETSKHLSDALNLKISGKEYVKSWTIPNYLDNIKEHTLTLHLMFETPLIDIPTHIEDEGIPKLIAKWRLSINK